MESTAVTAAHLLEGEFSVTTGAAGTKEHGVATLCYKIVGNDVPSIVSGKIDSSASISSACSSACDMIYFSPLPLPCRCDGRGLVPELLNCSDQLYPLSVARTPVSEDHL